MHEKLIGLIRNLNHILFILGLTRLPRYDSADFASWQSDSREISLIPGSYPDVSLQPRNFQPPSTHSPSTTPPPIHKMGETIPTIKLDECITLLESIRLDSPLHILPTDENLTTVALDSAFAGMSPSFPVINSDSVSIANSITRRLRSRYLEDISEHYRWPNCEPNTAAADLREPCYHGSSPSCFPFLLC